ncbi:hypothetical protein JL721_9373 [Aureococcus anophagefferens]|nr:hypothetical protein JL721_9373 [Aureococcus anophagefferens]
MAQRARVDAANRHRHGRRKSHHDHERAEVRDVAVADAGCFSSCAGPQAPPQPILHQLGAGAGSLEAAFVRETLVTNGDQLEEIVRRRVDEVLRSAAAATLRGASPDGQDELRRERLAAPDGRAGDAGDEAVRAGGDGGARRRRRGGAAGEQRRRGSQAACAAFTSVIQVQGITWLFDHDVEAYVDDDGVAEGLAAKMFPGGVPYPANIDRLTEEAYGIQKLFGVWDFHIMTIVFCAINVITMMQPELKQLKGGYALIVSRFGQVPVWRLAVAYVIHVLRFSVVWLFVDVSGRVLGASDGPFEIILNSLAVLFILDIDDLVKFDEPRRNFYGIAFFRNRKELFGGRLDDAHAELDAMFRRAAAGDKYRVKFDGAMTWLCPVLCPAALMWCMSALAILMQRDTSTGELIAIDDLIIDEDRDVNARYRAIRYATAAVLYLDVHSTAMLASKNEYSDQNVIKHRLWRVADFVLQACVHVVFRTVVIDWAIEELLVYHRSWNTDRLSFWQDLSIVPPRSSHKGARAYGDREADVEKYSGRVPLPAL